MSCKPLAVTSWGEEVLSTQDSILLHTCLRKGKKSAEQNEQQVMRCTDALYTNGPSGPA